MECKHCGKEFTYAYLGGRKRKFCTPSCKTANIAERESKTGKTRAQIMAEAKSRKTSVCKACGKTFIAKTLDRLTCCSRECGWELLRQRLGSAPKQEPYSKVYFPSCRVCGITFATNRISSVRCKSVECRHADYRIHSAKRYAQKITNAPCHNIDPLIVLARDGWKCIACGVNTPQSLRGTTEDNAPELDHIIPLSRGGPHTYDNTQCLCRACNRSKHAKKWEHFINGNNDIRGRGNCLRL